MYAYVGHPSGCPLKHLGYGKEKGNQGRKAQTYEVCGVEADIQGMIWIYWK
jgi:hypothetical protein